MFHFPASLKYRLKQTLSAVFQLCRFTVYPKDPPFRLCSKYISPVASTFHVLHTDKGLMRLHAMKILNVLEAELYVIFHFLNTKHVDFGSFLPIVSICKEFIRSQPT